MRLARRDRVRDLCERYGAAWVESPAEMLRRMSPAQRARLAGLRDEQSYLLARGELGPRLDPALAACAAGEMSRMEERVAVAGADRRLMRRALGLPHTDVRPRRDAVNVLSLCTGIGGLDLGLAIAAPETKVVCYVEKNRPCQELLRARMAGGDLDHADILDDLTKFDGRPWRGFVDLVAGGYPCQPFSTAGNRRGKRDERHLWPHIRKIVGRVRPEWCLFENVGGHLSLGAPIVVRNLVRLGYRVALGLFLASEVGAPHKRERLFVLAHRAGLPAGAEQAGPRVAERRGGWRQGAGARGEGVAGLAAVGDPGSRASAAGPGVQGRPRPRLSGPEVWRRSWGRPRLWPPRPDSWAAWRGVRALDPSLMPRAEGGINPAFVEWTMGFPRGWTEGMSRTARLHALGNAVVPAAATLAWHELAAGLARGAEE